MADLSRNPIEIQNLTRICNETLLLAVLGEGGKHGYQLAIEIEERSCGEFRFRHGTLYPILHQLEKEGLIRGRWRKEDRKRKVYSITARGRRRLAVQKSAWGRFFRSFTGIAGEIER